MPKSEIALLKTPPSGPASSSSKKLTSKASQKNTLPQGAVVLTKAAVLPLSSHVTPLPTSLHFGFLLRWRRHIRWSGHVRRFDERTKKRGCVGSDCCICRGRCETPWRAYRRGSRRGCRRRCSRSTLGSLTKRSLERARIPIVISAHDQGKDDGQNEESSSGVLRNLGQHRSRACSE